MHDMNDMDKEKMAKFTEEFQKLGVDKTMIDDSLIWTAKKVSYKLMKLRMILDDKGVDPIKAKEIINKLIAMAMDKDLTDIKKWHQDHDSEEKHHWK